MSAMFPKCVQSNEGRSLFVCSFFNKLLIFLLVWLFSSAPFLSWCLVSMFYFILVKYFVKMSILLSIFLSSCCRKIYFLNLPITILCRLRSGFSVSVCVHPDVTVMRESANDGRTLPAMKFALCYRP